ncbi:MAG: hypothetical protein GXO26_03875 [Crenarchaeota archaeon]|nr:hypothetical protein [Thermoproteota archaeon]
MAEVQKIELTESEFEVLSVMCELCKTPDCRLTWSDILAEISKRRARQGRKSMSKATLTQVLNKLVSLGLVNKQVEVKGVKLKVFYSLTDKGREFYLENVKPKVELKLREVVDLLAAALPPEEVKRTIMEYVEKYLVEREKQAQTPAQQSTEELE